MKVLTIYDKSGPKYHRCLLPLYLSDVEFIVNHSIIEEQLPGVDILFINRVVSNSTLQNICELRNKHGFKLVVDFDDHWRLDPDHYLYGTYQHFKASEVMEAYIQEADAVTVTHERLADVVYPLNTNVHIFPNALPDFGQFCTKRIFSPFKRLFWAGGITHRKDIELLKMPLKRLSFDSVQMVMGGYTENEEYRVMAKSFTNGGKLKHRIIQALPVENYYLSYQECDIALIPLRDTMFNSFKSNLKILEAANIGAPVIVSKVNPYLDFPDHLVNYVEKQTDWYKHIKNLISSDYSEQGKELQQYCKKHFNFDEINKQRTDLFYAICGKQREAKQVPSENVTIQSGSVA